MFASLAHFKDAVIRSAPQCNITCEATQRVLAGPACAAFGCAAFVHLAALRGREAELAVVASRLTVLREYAAETASGILLVSDSCSTREVALRFLLGSGQIHPDQHSQLLSLSRPETLSHACLAELLAKLDCFHSVAHPSFSSSVRFFADRNLHHHVATLLLDRGLLESALPSFVQLNMFAALAVLLAQNKRGPAALFVARHANALLRLDADATVGLLLALPQGRRLVLNVCVGQEMAFREQGRVADSELTRWISVLASATTRVGNTLDEDERLLMVNFSYLGRYLPLFDHIISSPPGSFSHACIRASLNAMFAMARHSSAAHRRETLAFMREHQPQLMTSIGIED